MIAEPSFGVDGKAKQLSGRRWSRAQTPYRGQHVLLCQCCGDVVGGEVEQLQTVGIKPESEGQFAAAEHADVADTRCCFQCLLQVLIEPAADEDRFVEAWRSTESENQEEVISRTVHVQALACHSLRKSPACQVHLVLNLDRVQLGIARFEAQAEAGTALTAAGRHALKPFQTIELFFENGRDALLHHFRTCRWERGAHTHSSWCQLWKVFKAEAHQCNGACQQHKQAADDGEHRPPQERLGDGPQGGSGSEASRS